MQLYIDSAEREVVTKLLATRMFAGVTSNPAILHKAGLGSGDITDFIKWTTDAGARRVFVQSWGRTTSEIVERGLQFREVHDDVVVKVTASREGIEAARQLSHHGAVLVTAAFSATQLVPVLASGATYIAPFVGQMTAAGRDGLKEVAAMQRVIAATGATTHLLPGSLRTPDQMLELASSGITHMTLGPAVWDACFTDELTAAAVTKFHELATT